MKLAVPEKGDDRMRSFVYVIRDRVGIHARPAGIVVKEAKKHSSEITVSLGEKRADAKSLTGLMSMGIRFGDEIRVEVSGGDEEAAYAAMEAVLKEHL